MDQQRQPGRAHWIAIIAVILIGVIVWFVADRRPLPTGDEVRPTTKVGS